jgi:glycosyltransferase involved in cell wall biosynthesis
MKVDFIINSLRGGGAERVMAILVNALEERNHDVGLITFSKGDAYKVNNNVRRLKLHTGRLRPQKLRIFFKILWHYRKRSKRPDLIVSFITQMNLISILIAKIYRIPIVVSEHTNHISSLRPFSINKWTHEFVYPLADMVTVLTEFDVDHFKSKKCTVMVMPNPCTYTPIKYSEADKDKVILAVGSLNRYHIKGFDNLIELMAEVFKEYPDWILKIVGGGETGLEYLKNLAQKNGVSDKIVFTGFSNNVGEIMRKSEIFILPSRKEGLPMGLTEAMSQAMSCIAYDCKTGPSDIITKDIDGLLIEDQNKEKMIHGLKKLISDKDLRRYFSRNALKNLERFNVNSVTKQWENLFSTISKKT